MELEEIKQKLKKIPNGIRISLEDLEKENVNNTAK